MVLTDTFLKIVHLKALRNAGLFLLGIGLLFYSGMHSIVGLSSESELQLYRPPHNIEHMSIGYQGIIADAFWIRGLQGIDLCEKNKQSKFCTGETWLFRLLKSTSDLVPQYRPVYSVGALTLSVLLNDQVGAGFLFDRGVHQFSTDWPIHYRAAYYYIYEDFNAEKAAKLLERTGQLGGPQWVFDLARKLKEKESRLKLAEFLLTDLKKMNASIEVQNKIQKQIESMR